MRCGSRLRPLQIIPRNLVLMSGFFRQAPIGGKAHGQLRGRVGQNLISCQASRGLEFSSQLLAGLETEKTDLLKSTAKEEQMMKTMRFQKQNRKSKPIGRTSQVMRVIRRVNSQEYFASDGWTKDPEEALPFADSLEAAQTAIEYGLTGVEVALRMMGADSDLFCIALR